MAEIRVLDKHTAELIAAGEVVERPASVVKELTENSIDAGAHAVTVEITGGGIALIEIRDDGCGIEPEYMHNAFVRHATSKITGERDLEQIHTLGFRGEALASVASVARVSLLSQTAEGECAWRYDIEGGEEKSLREDARPQGTTITVRDLFYNTPARMKFLKKDVSEGTFVQEALEHLALSHPEISFRFVREGKEQFFTPGDGRLESAARALYPRDYARELVPVEYTENNVRVHGLVTPPRAARASRSMQNFYVNGRYIKSRALMTALENAYRGVLMGGRFPGCVLQVELPPQNVDVNVHPAKTEVRFARENEVFSAVYKAVKSAVFEPSSMEKHLELEHAAKNTASGVQVSFSALPGPGGAEEAETEKPAPAPAESAGGSGAEAPGPSAPARPGTAGAAAGERESLPAEKTAVPGQGTAAAPLYPAEAAEAEPAEVADSTGEPAHPGRTFARNPFAGLDIAVTEDGPEGQSVSPPRETPASAAEDKEERPGAAAEPAAPAQTAPTPADGAFAPAAEPLQLVGEVFSTYIIAQRGAEICFIDKHAAHERLIYEELANSYGSVAGQLLLMPVSVELSAPEKTALLEHREYLDNIGFAVDDFGGKTVLVREVPSDIEADDIEDLVQEIAARLAAGQREPLSEKTTWVLHSIACRAAMKAGDRTHAPEMLRLAEDILAGKVPPFCPHGRPVVLKLTQKELEKQFGRLG